MRQERIAVALLRITGASNFVTSFNISITIDKQVTGKEKKHPNSVIETVLISLNSSDDYRCIHR